MTAVVGAGLMACVVAAEMSGQELLEVIITGTRDGLGIRIVGGVNTNSTEEAVFGIFVKEVIKGSLAGKDGKGQS